MPDEFGEAIEKVHRYALGQFNAAYTKLTTLPLSNPPPDTSPPELKRQHAADVAAAQNEMTAALKQLEHVEVVVSERRGRAGYDAVVTLMTKTQVAAGDAYDKLAILTANPTPSTTDQQRISMLTNLIRALARLSPAPVWGKAPASEAPTG